MFGSAAAMRLSPHLLPESVMLRKFAAVVFTAISPSAFALNLVTNPDFDQDLSGWATSAQSGGGAYRDYFFGSPDGGTLRLDATNTGSIAEAWQCVDLHAWTNMKLDVGVRLAKNSLAGTGYYGGELDIQDASGCGGNTLMTITINDIGNPVAGTNASTWTDAGVYGTDLPAGALSGKLYFGVAAGVAGASAFMIDHVQVGPLEEIFRDTFEVN
jgi:hypothetical protein